MLRKMSKTRFESSEGISESFLCSGFVSPAMVMKENLISTYFSRNEAARKLRGDNLVKPVEVVFSEGYCQLIVSFDLCGDTFAFLTPMWLELKKCCRLRYNWRMTFEPSVN